MDQEISGLLVGVFNVSWYLLPRFGSYSVSCQFAFPGILTVVSKKVEGPYHFVRLSRKQFGAIDLGK